MGHGVVSLFRGIVMSTRYAFSALLMSTVLVFFTGQAQGQFARVGSGSFEPSGNGNLSASVCEPAELDNDTSRYGTVCVTASDAVYSVMQGPDDDQPVLYRITPDGASPVINPEDGLPIHHVWSLRVGSNDPRGNTVAVWAQWTINDPLVFYHRIWEVKNGVATVVLAIDDETGGSSSLVMHAPFIGGNRIWWLQQDRNGNSSAITLRSSGGDVSVNLPLVACPSSWTCPITDVTVLPGNTAVIVMATPGGNVMYADLTNGSVTQGPDLPDFRADFSFETYINGFFIAQTRGATSAEGGAFYHISPSAMQRIEWPTVANGRGDAVRTQTGMYMPDHYNQAPRRIWRLDPVNMMWVDFAALPHGMASLVALGDRLVGYDQIITRMVVVAPDGTISLLPMNEVGNGVSVWLGDAVEYDGWLYFTGNDERYTTLWRTNGSVVETVGVPEPRPYGQAGRTVRSVTGVVDGRILVSVEHSAGTYPFTTEIWAYTPEPAGGGGGSDPVHTTLTPMGVGAGQRVWSIDIVLPADSGFVFGPNMYGDVAKAQAFAMLDGLTGVLESVDITWGYKKPSVPNGATYKVQVFDGTPQSGPSGSPLREMTFPMAAISADDDFSSDEQPMTYTFDPPVAVGTSFFVSVDFGSYDASINGAATLASRSYEGHRVPEVWELWSNGSWANVSDAWLDGHDGWLLWMSADVVTGQGVDAETPAELPSAVRLDAAYPNPFNPQTTITWALDVPAHARLAVYDALGREVRVLVDGEHPAGEYHAVFDAHGLASGLYLVRLQTPGHVLTRQIILLK